MQLTVISPEGIVLDTQAGSVTLPGTEGGFTVLENHAPLLATLEAGRIRYSDANDKNANDKNANESKGMDIAGGIAEVKHNRVTVIVSPGGQTR